MNNSFIYYNLRKKTWSIRQKGLVVGYSDVIQLRNVTPKVSEAGRQRVLRRQRKDIHAGLVGEIEQRSLPADDPTLIEITYNPYKYATFVEKISGKEFLGASKVLMINKRCFAWDIKN